MNKINFDETRAEGNNYFNLALSYNSLEQAVNQFISSAAWEENYLYQMARLNYDFQDKYLITATIRRDGFSGFAANNKFGLFPSFGLGRVLSKEGFLADAASITFLKLRASYGINGNLTSRYSSLARVGAGAGSQYVFGAGGSTVNGQQITSLANPDLSWERTAGFNIGADFSLFGSIVSGSIGRIIVLFFLILVAIDLVLILLQLKDKHFQWLFLLGTQNVIIRFFDFFRGNLKGRNQG